MDKIKNLLQQVSIIQKKYDDLAEYSGEHFNVFDILGVRSDELSHSAILTNLLNAKGQHGQKELFLELFIKEVKEKFTDSDKKSVLDNFNIKNSFAVKEKFAGRVEEEQGGRIDIVINDGKNNIIIENKIYASDQPKQLTRYNEHDKNAPILYLTLCGKEPCPDSRGSLILDTDFVCISYAVFIKNWLENCIKEMANKPIIRETLNQYLFLIKSLTNQLNNNKMKEEIINSLLQNESNFKSVIEIIKITNDLKLFMITDIVNRLKRKLIANGYEIQSELKFNSNRQSGELISFSNDLMNKKDLCIRLNFEDREYGKLIMGFYNTKEKIEIPELYTNYKRIFSKALKTFNYPSFIIYDEYNYWGLETLNEIYYNYEDFETKFMDKVDLHLEIIMNQS